MYAGYNVAGTQFLCRETRTYLEADDKDDRLGRWLMPLEVLKPSACSGGFFLHLCLFYRVGRHSQIVFSLEFNAVWCILRRAPQSSAVLREVLSG